jgi:hypothetical protein
VRAGDLFDALLALALAGTAQYEIWVHPLFDDGIPGPRLPNALLLLLITVPLAWRRRAPTVVFALVLASVGLQISLIDEAHSDQPPFQLWIALLVVFYSLGAHAGRRRALVAGALGGAAVFVGDLVDLVAGDATVEDTVPAWFMLAAAYGVGFACAASGSSPRFWPTVPSAWSGSASRRRGSPLPRSGFGSPVSSTTSSRMRSA